MRTDYLNIHEKAYRQLRAQGKSSWSEPQDLAERIQFYQQTLARNGIPQGSRVLILGCGDGESSLALASLGFNVVGVDISPTAVQWADGKAKVKGLPCQFSVNNIVTGLTDYGTFHAIIDDHCFHCIIGVDRGRAFAQVRSILKPDGIFLMRTQCGDPPEDCDPEFLKMWDPLTRCQVHNGVAGRYFGLPDQILSEVEAANLEIIEQQVFAYPNGWSMLQVVARVKK